MLKNNKRVQCDGLEVDLLDWFYTTQNKLSYEKQSQLNKLYALDMFHAALQRKTIKKL